MISTAWAADAHGGGGMFSDPAFWVGVAFVLFLALAGKTIVKGLAKVLDDRTALIARTLGEAESLRNEAHKARDEAQKSLADSARLAQEITGDIQFSRATVNYVWAQLMGVGLVDPVDGFDLARLDPRNPPPAPWTVQPSHPELLDELARSFINMNYDLKGLIREIVNSQAFQLSARYDGAWDPNWARYQARHLVRRMDSEELVDALVQSSGVPNPMTVVNYTTPFAWAMQLPDTTVGGGTAQAFLDDFLRGDRDENPRRRELTTTQALSLMNDTFVTNRVRQAAVAPGKLAALLAANADNGALTKVRRKSRLPTRQGEAQAANWTARGTRLVHIALSQFSVMVHRGASRTTPPRGRAAQRPQGTPRC